VRFPLSIPPLQTGFTVKSTVKRGQAHLGYFWWPARTDPDDYDDDQARAMSMAILRYRELYGEAQDAEILGKLALVSDLEADD
jgi:hypothetical protein